MESKKQKENEGERERGEGEQSVTGGGWMVGSDSQQGSQAGSIRDDVQLRAPRTFQAPLCFTV